MRLPVRTALLQNYGRRGTTSCFSAITSQNGTAPKLCFGARHIMGGAITSQNGTAPKLIAICIMLIVVRLPVRTALLQNRYLAHLDSEEVRLPVRTALLQNLRCLTRRSLLCDYQSERHCSKTQAYPWSEQRGAITSQNGTAPKLYLTSETDKESAITSQNGTAPKHLRLDRKSVV